VNKEQLEKYTRFLRLAENPETRDRAKPLLEELLKEGVVNEERYKFHMGVYKWDKDQHRILQNYLAPH